MLMRSAGDLVHRYAFDRRVSVDRGDGVMDGDWQQVFVSSAGIVHLRGGEAVMQGRLAGQHPQIIFVRSSTLSRQVASDWRVRDVRSGVDYNIRDITPSSDGLWLDFLVQSGVNPG